MPKILQIFIARADMQSCDYPAQIYDVGHHCSQVRRSKCKNIHMCVLLLTVRHKSGTGATRVALADDRRKHHVNL